MEKTIRMPKDLLEKWLAALRSGEYKQAQGSLANNGGYCCLGVLQHCTTGEVEMADDKAELVPTRGWLLSRRIYFEPTHGFSEVSPYLPTFCTSASNANDTGATFAEIADAIEACAEGI